MNHLNFLGSQASQSPAEVSQPMEVLDTAATEQIGGGMLLVGFAIGMLIDHYLIKPLWDN